MGIQGEWKIFHFLWNLPIHMENDWRTIEMVIAQPNFEGFAWSAEDM